MQAHMFVRETHINKLAEEHVELHNKLALEVCVCVFFVHSLLLLNGFIGPSEP
jgi:hypothetical protein